PNPNGSDVYTDPSELTATVTAIHGGNFEATDVAGASTTVKIGDVIDTTTVSVTAVAATENDANVTFNFQLSNVPQAGVAASLTVNVGGTEHTVMIDADGKGVLRSEERRGGKECRDPREASATERGMHVRNLAAPRLARERT